MDALASDDFPRGVLESIRENRTFELKKGVVRLQATTALAGLTGGAIDASRHSRSCDVEQFPAVLRTSIAVQTVPKA